MVRRGGGRGGKASNNKYQNKNKFVKKKTDKTLSLEPKSTFARNYKHIQRSKEAEELLKRQQDAEVKYRKQVQIDESSSESEEEEAVDHFEQLLTTLDKSKRKKAIESSEDEISENESLGDEEEAGESVDEDAEDGVESGSDLEKDSADEEANSVEDEDVTSEDDEDEKVIPEKSEPEENDEDSEEEDQDDEAELGGEYDSELEDDDEEVATKSQANVDPYNMFLNHDLSSEMLESVSSTPQNCNKFKQEWPTLGQLQIEIPKDKIKPKAKKLKTSLEDDEVTAAEGTVPTKIDPLNVDLKKLMVKQKVHKNIEAFSPLQAELFSIFNNYQDIYYPHRSIDNAEEIRYSYCLHALNHVLKSRTKVLHHNAKLNEKVDKKKKKRQKQKTAIIPESYRDQGLVRPKVLIVVPFRDSALKVINILKQILVPTDPNGVLNYKRFCEEFGGEGLYFPKTNPKPEDYEQTFSGNTDDTFRIGLSFNKKCIKLYTKFYSSDIIVASPLGLRMTIGAAGETDRDYDFLASVELMVLDQAELFLAQNWDHFLHLLDHLHLQPQTTRNTDFARVRSWCLNGWSRFYRQSLLFTSHDLPEFRSLYNNRFLNYRGKMRTMNPCLVGSIRHVTVPISQVFHRIEVTSVQSSFDTRFQHFVNVVLPQCKTISMAHCMIYIPSYFDYVRLRNYFKKEELSYVQICEYSKDGKVARARDMFYHGSVHFMLYSERSHFFRRTRVKGVRHLVIYQPPTWPHFYSEMINLMQDSYQNSKDGIDNTAMTVTVLYTKYDILRVSAIVGSDRASRMAQSEKTTHMFMTGD